MQRGVSRDIAPVIAALALLAHSLSNDVIVAYPQRTWNLDDIDAEAALVPVRREHGAETVVTGAIGVATRVGFVQACWG